MNDDSRALIGIGGWLAFFIFSLIFISPLVTIFSTVSDLYGSSASAIAAGPGWALVQASEWGICACMILACWYLAWRLITKRVWQTIRIVVPCLWILAILPLTLEMLLVAALVPVSLEQFIVLLGGSLIRPTISATIWSAYFLQSKRVENTYERYADESGGALADVFE